MRIPDAMWTRLTPGTARALRVSAIVGAWLVPSSLQIAGWMHERRLQTASTSARVQRIWYMVVAVGPPERAPPRGAPPVGLRQDGDPEAARLEHAREHRHRERGVVVDVGVAGHEDDVGRAPAARTD